MKPTKSTKRAEFVASATPILLTTDDVAELLGVHPVTLANWRRYGRGPKFVRTSDSPRARVFYRLSDVEEWADSL